MAETNVNAQQETNLMQVPDVRLENIFESQKTFVLAQRMAAALSSSTIVPKDYQGNIGNCIIALEMANRLRTSPLMVMQNLYIVNGRPAWSSQYVVAMINSSRKYKTELQYELTGKGDSLSCFAFVEDKTGHIVKGPVITMQMAKDEGWYSRNGSKWKTMPEVMIRYRAAAFFGRLNCPDMIMGIYSDDEIIELEPSQYSVIDQSVAEAEAEIAEKANAVEIDTTKEPEPEIDKETGEIKQAEQTILPPAF
jgi:phage anti-repressor protein